MLHTKFHLSIATKSQISNHAIFFHKVSGDFITAKAGIKNNSLQPIVITRTGTIPENGEYSDGFFFAECDSHEDVLGRLNEYVKFLNSNSYIKIDLLGAIHGGKESLFIELIKDADGNCVRKENIIDEPNTADKPKKEKVAKAKPEVDADAIKALSVLEKTVLAKCFDVAGVYRATSSCTDYLGFSFRVCEGNLSLAGAFSTLQRKGYIDTFFDKVDKRKEKFFKIIRNADGNLL